MRTFQILFVSLSCIGGCALRLDHMPKARKCASVLGSLGREYDNGSLAHQELCDAINFYVKPTEHQDATRRSTTKASIHEASWEWIRAPRGPGSGRWPGVRGPEPGPELSISKQPHLRWGPQGPVVAHKMKLNRMEGGELRSDYRAPGPGPRAPAPAPRGLGALARGPGLRAQGPGPGPGPGTRGPGPVLGPGPWARGPGPGPRSGGRGPEPGARSLGLGPRASARGPGPGGRRRKLFTSPGRGGARKLCNRQPERRECEG